MEPGMLGAWLAEYKYWAIFPLAIVEGPIIMTVTGFLLKLGQFEFWPLYFVLMAGDLTADIFWYVVGFFGGRPLIRKYGRFLSISEDLIGKTELKFHKYQNKILFISKLTMGLGFAPVILMTAGISKVPFRKYITFNFLGQFIWTAFLISVGYFFGKFYLYVNQGLRTFSVIAFVAIVVAAVYGINNHLKTKRALEDL